MIKQLRRIGLALAGGALLLAFASGNAIAQSADVKGVGSATYDKALFSGDKPRAEDRQKAVNAAKISAWKNLTANFSQAKTKLLMGAGDEFVKNLDNYIIATQVVDEKVDQDSRTITVVARVSFNMQAIDQALEAKSGVAGGGGANMAAMRSDGSTFMFLFMSRKVSSAKRFDDKHVEIVEQSVKVSKTGSRNQHVGGGSASVGETAEVTAEGRVATGGSTETKEDKLVYNVASSQDVDAAMGDVLTTSGVEPVGYDDVVSNCGGADSALVKKEFSTNDDISQPLRAKIIDAARRCEVRYFALGTLDIGAKDIDPVSGNTRVTVSVRAQLWDISQKLPKKIGSVGPVQYAGLGPDETVAMRNGLIKASKEGGKNLMDQLNAKKVR